MNIKKGLDDSGIITQIKESDILHSFKENGTGVYDFSAKVLDYEEIKIGNMGNSIIDFSFDSSHLPNKITKIHFPINLVSIGREAFARCDLLHGEVNLIGTGVRNISERAFYRSGITSLALPGIVNTISKECFMGCTELTSVRLSPGIKGIGESAFSNCRALKEISLPDSISNIGKNAFLGCNNLETINLPEWLTSIGEHAFSDCTSLKHVTIPESVKEIGDNIFDGCTNLRSVTYKGKVYEVECLGDKLLLKDSMKFIPVSDRLSDFLSIAHVNSFPKGETCILTKLKISEEAQFCHSSEFNTKGISEGISKVIAEAAETLPGYLPKLTEHLLTQEEHFFTNPDHSQEEPALYELR